MDHHGNRRQFSGSDTTNTIVWCCHEGRPGHGMALDSSWPGVFELSPAHGLQGSRYG
jgi:hypothetical protein